MITAQQYRAKATQYAGLAATARSASESREFRALERNCTSLAANAEWLAGSDGQGAPALWQIEHARVEEEQILRCLGAALIMQWTALPKKSQREIFEYACFIGDLQQATALKGRIARFLHKHKDEGGRPRACGHFPAAYPPT